MNYARLFNTLTGQSVGNARKGYNVTADARGCAYKLVCNDEFGSRPERIVSVSINYDWHYPESKTWQFTITTFNEDLTKEIIYDIQDNVNEVARKDKNTIEVYAGDGEIAFLLTKM